MTQDTRKDRRVKIVSLNVRYKSATVDEFIENHAHDVSRGGIFIKTANPFPAGTLLKFEIRLASDQAVIAGVGRIVWKRDAGSSHGERPAGMGVKFIKLDEPSKVVIDRLVNTRSDAGKSFETTDSVAPGKTSPPPPRPPIRTPSPAVGSSTPGMSGMRSVTPVSGTPSPARSISPAAGTPTAAATPQARKATIMGLGISSPPPSPRSPLPASPIATPSPPRTPFSSTPTAPPRPASSAPMFPAGGVESDVPPKQEQTVMKQAAELLEEALREAGGSMEEIGMNPLFSAAADVPQQRSTLAPEDHTRSESPQALAASAAAEKQGADATLHEADVQQPRESKRPARETPASAPPALAAPSAAMRLSERAPARKGGSGALVVATAAAAAIALGIFLFRDQLFGGASAPPEPAAAPPEPPAATATRPLPAMPTTATASAPAAVVAPAAGSTPRAAPETPASSSNVAGQSATPAVPPVIAASALPVAAPPRLPKPMPKPAAVAPSAQAAASAAEPSTPSTAETGTTGHAGAAPTPEATASASASAPAKPAPPAKTKPVKPAADDNPY